MDTLTVNEIKKYILEFLEIAAPQMECVMVAPNGSSDQIDSDGNLKTIILPVHDTLAMWAQLPDGAYTPMFVGWLIGQGVGIKRVTPILIAQAVAAALTGSDNSIMINTWGDIHGSQKLN